MLKFWRAAPRLKVGETYYINFPDLFRDAVFFAQQDGKRVPLNAENLKIFTRLKCTGKGSGGWPVLSSEETGIEFQTNYRSRAGIKAIGLEPR